jgi:type VI secretion system protein ImpL
MKLFGLIFRLIFNQWVLLIVGLAAIALVIWWVGPAIAIYNTRPFEEEWVRWLQIAILALIPVVKWSWKTIKARRGNAALAQGLLQKPAKAAPVDPSAAEVAQLGQRFEQALGLLRQLRFGTAKPSLLARTRSLGSQQYLYDLPWYVFIGAPGSGKTTALINSGLRFPLADRMGREAVRGVGGTRNCDWWFTDEAIFVDTAGRYTTQEANREVDAGAWKGFLQLLKKARPRRPINGLLVTISVGDLIQQSAAEREAQAQAVRTRVQELYHDLGVRFPIYVLVTKSDLLAGFSEFFTELGQQERAQVWGYSLPLGDQRLDPAKLSTQLERLEGRLYSWLPERLEEERDPARRALVYRFPEQFALLRERLVAFVDATFAPTRFEAVARLRGVYFTSGTQEGSPIDRAMGALARDLGLERQLLAPQRPSGRSYFLTRLLREVVFPEAGLAGVDLRWERRRQWLRRAAMAGALTAVVLGTAAWWTSDLHNRRYLAEVAAQLGEVTKQVAAFRPGVQSDLSTLLPILSRVRTLSETRTTPDGSVPWSWRFGLYQGGTLDAASQAAYQRMLQDTLLPSMTTYLGRALARDATASPASPEAAYDTLKTYVMLYDAKHFNRDAVWLWFLAHGRDLVSGAGVETGKALKTHFDALYERGWVMPTVERNDALVAQARSIVARDELAKRVYDRLKREPMPDVREFTVAEKGGAKSLLVFERTTGEPLTKGIAGLYTKDGYYKHFARRLQHTALQLAEEESWVMGAGGGTASTAIASPKVAESVRLLYLADYERTWRRFINDITVVRQRDFAKIIDITQIMAGPDTPLKPLIKAIDRETRLSAPPTEGDSAIGGRVQGVTEMLSQFVGTAPPGALEKALVDSKFEDLARLVGPGGPAPAPLDATIALLNDYYIWLVAARAALDAAQAPPPPDAANKLRGEAKRQPEMLRNILEQLEDGGRRQVLAGVQQQKIAEERLVQEKAAAEQKQLRDKQIAEQRQAQEQKALEARQAKERQLAELKQTRERADAELRVQVTEFCTKAIRGRYPFDRASSQDVTPEDFARLFAPAGVLDGFFQKFLAAHTDTTQNPWRFRDPVMGPSTSLAEFQRAQVIRDVFFVGATGPSIQLDFKPVEMDVSIRQIALDVDGKVVSYAHGPQVPVRVQFPGPGGRSQVRVSIAPPTPSGSSGRKYEGPWALFRMLDGSQIQPTSQPDRFVAILNFEGRRATFEIFARSVRNPFNLPELSQFRCPAAL